MQYDNHKFNVKVIGPKKTALNRMIDNAKTACQLAMTADDAKELCFWADRWRSAVCMLRVINAVDVCARRNTDVDVIVKDFQHRAMVGCNDYKQANEFAVTTLKEYRETIKDGR